MRNISLHVIHCSDSMHGDVAEIRRWHKARGWRDVGYHFVIRRDGEIEIGRMLTDIGAHAKGFNRNSIGTCLIGKDNDFTEAQFDALRRLDASLRSQFDGIKTVEHRELNSSKTCPTFDINKVLKG